MLAAARDSSDPQWSQTALGEDPDQWVRPVPDLSE